MSYDLEQEILRNTERKIGYKDGIKEGKTEIIKIRDLK